jgi:hypothetical protein
MATQFGAKLTPEDVLAGIELKGKRIRFLPYGRLNGYCSSGRSRMPFHFHSW